MEKVEVLTRFISSSLEIRVDIWDNSKNSLYDFEKQNCFLPGIQPQLTADALELFMGALKKRVVYEIHDVLGLRVIFLLYEKRAIIIGPFVEDEWDDVKARETMAKLKLPVTYEIPYKLYYCGYSAHSTKSVSRIVDAAICSLSPDEPMYNHRVVAGFYSSDIHGIHNDDPPAFDVVESRYRFENEFLHMMQQGKQDEALNIYKKMSNYSSVPHNAPLDLRTVMILATVGRTLMRKAAELAGLQPAVVDSISQACAQKLNTAESSAEVNYILQNLLVEFSNAIREIRRENFSPHVRKAADYIKLHLSKPLPLNEISGVLGITANHLSHIFKKEAGVSVSQYIAEKRCNRAGELLLATQLSVQEISTHVGYLDSNYFVKVFKAQYNATPSDYRRQNKPNFPLAKK